MELFDRHLPHLYSGVLPVPGKAPFTGLNSSSVNGHGFQTEKLSVGVGRPSGGSRHGNLCFGAQIYGWHRLSYSVPLVPVIIIIFSLTAVATLFA